ncbi:MAG: hypothetical protein LUG16_07735 [Candidatus Gastranaerophilales bacterium]|nr:hypothetical protein [Candidatus Gastranaerophilales bacterium]
MKKFFVIILILSFAASGGIIPPVFAAPYEGHIEATDTKKQEQNKIFTNEVKKIDSDNEINLVVSQVLAGTTSIEGDEFFAEVSQDVLAGSGVLLPKGTVAHGSIRNIVNPKRMNRDGYIELSFDYLITPDGREIPIEGDMTSRLSAAKSVARTAGEGIVHTAVGGVYGAVAAIELAGIEGAVLSNGYTVIGGAAIGGVIALGLSLFRKGKDVLISPGDEIRVKIRSAEKIPVMTFESVRQEEISYDGLDVSINDIYLEKDPFDNLNTITLDLVIKNHSGKDFSAFDIAMINDLHNSYNPSIFSDYKNSLAMKTIKNGENISGVLSFAVDNPARQHWLVFYDRRTHSPLAKISIDNAKKDLNITDITKKKKKKRK